MEKDYRNITTTIRKQSWSPEGQRGEEMWPLTRGSGSLRGQTQRPCMEAKVMLVSSA